MGYNPQKAHRLQPDLLIHRHTRPEGSHRNFLVSGVNAMAEPEQLHKLLFFPLLSMLLGSCAVRWVIQCLYGLRL